MTDAEIEWKIKAAAEADAAKVRSRGLGRREKQIVHLIQQAKSNKQIAYELGLTYGTVKEYVYHIFRKLNVSNRTELALWGHNQDQPDHSGSRRADS